MAPVHVQQQQEVNFGADGEGDGSRGPLLDTDLGARSSVRPPPLHYSAARSGKPDVVR